MMLSGTIEKTEVVPIANSSDVVVVRQRVRVWTTEMKFSLVDQTKIVTAASELGRNTLEHGGGGSMELALVVNGVRRGIRMSFSDQGPGIPDIAQARKAGYTSGGGMGLGLGGSRRLMNEFEGMALLSRCIQINPTDKSQTGNARRQAMTLAEQIGYDELRQGQLSIIVTEAARNIEAHGGGGEILLSPWTQGNASGIDMLALDKGRGIDNVSSALQDGFSTAGTPGNGLGAMSRLSGTFQIYTSPGNGTAVFSRVLRTAQDLETDEHAHALSAISLPIAGETVCGDVWSV